MTSFHDSIFPNFIGNTNQLLSKSPRKLKKNGFNIFLCLHFEKSMKWVSPKLEFYWIVSNMSLSPNPKLISQHWFPLQHVSRSHVKQKTKQKEANGLCRSTPLSRTAFLLKRIRYYCLNTEKLLESTAKVRLRLMTTHDYFWWLIMTHDDSLLLLMTHYDSYWLIMTHDYFWWLIMTHDES